MVKQCLVVNTVSDKIDTKICCSFELLVSVLGVRECEGNMFQSCVLDVIGDDQDKQTSFVICAMDFNKNPPNCAQNMGLDMTKVNDCTNGPRGTKLQLEAEEFSRHIIGKSAFVPTIVFQGAYKAGDQWGAIEDFETVVKEQLKK